MSDRETKEITTTGGKVVKIKTYLTGAENNDLKRVLFSGVSVDADKKVSSISLSASLDRESKLLELAVVSFDGSDAEIVGRMQDLPSTEYEEVVKQIENELKLNFQTAK